MYIVNHNNDLIINDCDYGEYRWTGFRFRVDRRRPDLLTSLNDLLYVMARNKRNCLSAFFRVAHLANTRLDLIAYTV